LKDAAEASWLLEQTAAVTHVAERVGFGDIIGFIVITEAIAGAAPIAILSIVHFNAVEIFERIHGYLLHPEGSFGCVFGAALSDGLGDGKAFANRALQGGCAANQSGKLVVGVALYDDIPRIFVIVCDSVSFKLFQKLCHGYLVC